MTPAPSEAPRRRPAQPLPGARLCALSDLADPGAKGFLFREGDRLFQGFVVRKGDGIKGFLDRCPHAGFPLALVPDRYLTREKDLIICASHGALFRLDGLCIGGPCAGARLLSWPVGLDQGWVVAA